MPARESGHHICSQPELCCCPCLLLPVQDAWAHRATDPSVLKRHGRNSGSGFSTLLAWALLVLLAAVVLQQAQQAGWLRDLPYDIDGLVQQAAAAVQPAVEAITQQAQKLLGN